MIALQAGGTGTGNMIILLGMVVVFVFFIIVPQFKRQRELKKFRSELKRGDAVITTGGIFGKVVEITNDYVVIVTDEKTKLKVAKQALVKDVTGITPTK